MPIPPNVVARRNISQVTAITKIPDYPGLQGVIFLGPAGKPAELYSPPYPPNTPVPAGVQYLDVMDDGVQPLPVSPGPKYVCYFVSPPVDDGAGGTTQFIVDQDTFPPLAIRHNYSGWPNPTE